MNLGIDVIPVARITAAIEKFGERFLKVQLVFESPAPPPIEIKATKRYNAMGVLEDMPSDQAAGTNAAVDVGPAEIPANNPEAS